MHFYIMESKHECIKISQHYVLRLVEDVELNRSKTLSESFASELPQKFQSIVTCFHKSNKHIQDIHRLFYQCHFSQTKYISMLLWSFSSFTLTLCDTQNKHQNKTYNKKHYSYKHHSSTISIFHKQQTYCKKSLLLHIFCHLNVNQKSSALHSSNQSQLKEFFCHIYIYTYTRSSRDLWVHIN